MDLHPNEWPTPTPSASPGVVVHIFGVLGWLEVKGEEECRVKQYRLELEGVGLRAL